MQKKSIFKQYVLPIIGITVATVLTCIFIGLTVPKFTSGWIFKYAKAVLSTGIILTIVAYIVSLVTLFFHIEAVHKLIFTILVLVAVSLIGLYIMQCTGFYEVINSKDKLQAWISSKGAWPPVIFTLLQFLQVCVLPIPSTVTVWAGVTMFGPYWCMLYSFIGILLGSIAAFYIGRFLGYKVVVWIVGKEELDKWMKKLKGKDTVLITAMFLLPLFPDDVLCFVAGLTKMSSTFFILMQVISRGINTVVSCLLLDNIAQQLKTWWGITLWSVAIVAVIIGMVFLWKYGEQIENWFIKKFSKKKKVEQEDTENTAVLNNVEDKNNN